MKEILMQQERRENRTDGLALVGLGRIERCAGCPRYRGLVGAYRGQLLQRVLLAPVPESCSRPYCAPLALRYAAQAQPQHWLQRAVG